MTTGPVQYEFDGDVATITIDDGRANALSPTVFAGLVEAVDRAEADGAAIVLAGRPGRFSAGFDLGVLGAGGPTATELLRSGFLMTHRLLHYPRAVVIACTGHAIAMGAFLLTAGDYRVAADGDFRITANEVAIGMTMPAAAIEVCRQRLTPAGMTRALVLAEVFTPASAVEVGFVDRVVPADTVVAEAQAAARAYAALHPTALRETKWKLRTDFYAALARALDEDTRGWEALFG